ncbi:L30e-like protein [Gymnopus androsaceus JB14]|uniref:60S ribosomal protein L8 n=1 Tax=Gymnopus androsaceus JB14 TaxID=1447944 RepID=A0A6A4GSZ4_9AGAR|nr:L30e-like protein [Gymnopus androsaceus JB14]
MEKGRLTAPSQPPTVTNGERRVGESISQDIRPKTDLIRFINWPDTFDSRGEKLFSTSESGSTPPYARQEHCSQLFKLFNKYCPESKIEKRERLTKTAEQAKNGKVPSKDETKKPHFVKYGLNHVVALIEAKKANLVAIAHDVDPIELVIYLPALCRKMGVPYVIIKGKARLGTLVHKKTAAVVAINEVRSEDQRELATLISAAKSNFTDKFEEERRVWGGGARGPKSSNMLRKRAKAMGKSISDLMLGSSEKR